MEKNERLAWRTKPSRTYCRCCSSCPKRHCKGIPFQLQIKKTTFRALKSCFFPSRHSWEQALSFSGAFPAAQSLIAKGDRSKKKQLFGSRKVVPEKLFFSLPDTLGSRHWAFQVLFQLPKAPLQRETLLGAGTELFSCFSSCSKPHCKGRPFQLQIQKWFFIFPSRHSCEQALSFSGAFPAAQSFIAKGDPSNCKLKKQLFGPWKVVFFPKAPRKGPSKELVQYWPPTW